jgi:hypothetical protein
LGPAFRNIHCIDAKKILISQRKVTTII